MMFCDVTSLAPDMKCALSRTDLSGKWCYAGYNIVPFKFVLEIEMIT